MNIDEYCPKQYIILHGQQPGDIIFCHFYLPNDTWCNKFKPNFGTHQNFSKMTILSVQIQGYILRLFSIEREIRWK